MFECTTLDLIASHCKKMVITDNSGEQREVSGKQAACIIAGVAYRKYVNGESIRVKFAMDYQIGCRILRRANYGNGYIEIYEYEFDY